MATKHVDVIIIGAGLSGIGAACHLKKDSPNKSYAIFEGREAMGGTWDLFRYPGIRSDSDMHTLGYSFKPWIHEKSIADGSTILDYIRAAAKDYEVEKHIRYNHRVTKIAWDTSVAIWTVTVSETGKRAKKMTCKFIYSCTGTSVMIRAIPQNSPVSNSLKVR